MKPVNSLFSTSVTEAFKDMENPEWGLRRKIAQIALSEKTGYLLGRGMNTKRAGELVNIYDWEDTFVGLYFPTRGWKGVSFIIPNALNWTHSVFANDPKVETFHLVAAARRYIMGNYVFCVQPNGRAPYVSKYNFLDEVRVKTLYEIPDAYNLATSIVDPDGTGFRDAKEAVWKKRSRDLLSAMILHILWCPMFKEKSLPVLIDYATDKSRSFEDKLQDMLSFPHDIDGRYGFKDVFGNLTRTHPYISAKIGQQKERTPQEATSVRGEAESYLSYYQSPIVRENSSRSDFSMRDLMDSDVASYVSLGITPDELEAAQPYIRLFLNLLINRNLTEIVPDPVTGRMKPAHPRSLAMMMDEFPIFGKLDLFAKQLAFIAGYRMRAAIICQDYQQILGDYGQYEALSANTNTMVCGQMNTTPSAKHFSELFGKRTVGLTKFSESTSIGTQDGRSFSKNFEVKGQEVFRPEELRSFSKSHSILAVAGRNPTVLEKLAYYEEDSRYSHLIATSVDEVTDSIPKEMQITHREAKVQQAEYLDWCISHGDGVTEAMDNLEANMDKNIATIAQQRDAYINSAYDQQKFAFS